MLGLYRVLGRDVKGLSKTVDLFFSKKAADSYALGDRPASHVPVFPLDLAYDWPILEPAVFGSELLLCQMV